MADRKFWAKRGKFIEGPYASREEAISAFSKAHPVKGPAYMKRARANHIMVGYGEGGPSFDIQWHQEV